MQASERCNRTNNNIRKLLECVTVEGVMAHEVAFQAIADENGDTRASGTPGYDASVEYVHDTLVAAGYQVTLQPFEFNFFLVTGPATLRQTAPGQVTYVEGVDYGVLAQTDPGTVEDAPSRPSTCNSVSGTPRRAGARRPTSPVSRPATSRCCSAVTCTFELKSENAAAAGASGVIFFNQGNTTAADRNGIPAVTMGNGYTGGHPQRRRHLRPSASSGSTRRGCG